MDDRARTILARTPGASLDTVAASALGVKSATVVGATVLTPVAGHIADPRTLGVVVVSGSADIGNGSCAMWSAVAKVIDLAGRTTGEVEWTRPEIEEIVYEESYFAGDGQRFRPARCYLVSRPEGTTKVFWLEDLSGAEHVPFGVEQLSEMARHLGEWSGTYRTVPDLKFPLPRDLYLTRWALPVLQNRLTRIRTLEPAALQKIYRDVPVEALFELRALLIAQNERTKTHPHGLTFGDCHVGNLFHRPGETIAVDWATLANDPIGADGGSMIGSMLGRVGVVEVIRNEHALFDCYFAGLRASGWRGKRDDIRRGYFCQFGHYLASTVGLAPVMLEHGDWPRADIEKRFGAPWDEIPSLLAEAIATYPSYLEEVKGLAER